MAALSSTSKHATASRLPALTTLAASLLLYAGHALSTTLPDSVSQALRQAQIPPEAVAVMVQPVDADKPLLSHNTQTSLNPASVMKLLTTYAALDLLGPSWTWKTTAWVEQAAVDGQLNGNLYLKGSGDPQFAMEHLWSLLRQLQVRGIRHIQGDIVLDRSIFAVPLTDPSAFDDKPMRPYNIGPDGLLLNFRALRFTLQVDGRQVSILQETPSDQLRLDNRLKLTDKDCSSNWKDAIQTRLYPEREGGARLEFTGSYAFSCGERSLNLAPLGPDAHAEGLIRALWQELGGSLKGRVRTGTIPIGSALAAEQESPPLADAVRGINKFSNNVMARHLYLALGQDGSNTPLTLERSQQRLFEWLTSRGLRFPELYVENGSGLSRRERMSANSLNQLLLHAWRSPVMPELPASLPIAGNDGTMKKRLRQTAASGRAHIKTGTLDGVKTAAGYVLDQRGRRYTYVFLINHPQASAGSAAMDALLVWLSQR